MFTSLELREPRKNAFWTSVGVHAVLLTVLLLVPLVFTDTLKLRPYDLVVIVAPPQPKDVLEVTPYRLPPIPKIERPAERIVAPPPLRPAVTSEALRKPPELEVAKLEKVEPVVVPPKPKVVEPLTGPENALKPPAPKPEVKTGLFSAGSSAKPTTDLPARQVQTGGFGDPNGVRGEGRTDKIANVASLGSFDLPAGPGAGNGTGGAKGTRGVVASSGFGSGVAPVNNNSDGSAARAVRQGGFADAQPAEAKPQAKMQEAALRETPVEITFKPRPDYTEEARQRKVEGEVLLRVSFGANGELRVLESLRGLGYGLDENARKAAQQIRFKPAMRGGQPVDSVATVHIVFQMAY
jgi:TonB family protein